MKQPILINSKGKVFRNTYMSELYDLFSFINSINLQTTKIYMHEDDYKDIICMNHT